MMHLGTIKTGKSNTKIIAGFAIAALVIVFVVIYFSFSKATISVYPKALSQEATFAATIDQNPNLDPRKIETISGRILTAEKEGTKDVTEVSEKTLERRATGTIRLTNTTSKSQPLLATTQLVNSAGVKFRTDSRVVVPAGGSVSVGVTADVPGATGNIDPGRLTIIKLFKGLQDQIYGTLDTKITNGTYTAQVVTDQDIENAKNTLADELYDSLQTELEEQIKEGEKILPDGVRKEILSFNSSVQSGAQADKFTVTEKVRSTAVVFDEASLLELAEAKLKTDIPAGRELVNVDTSDLSYTVTSYDLNKGTAQLKVTFKGTTIVKLSNEIFNKSKVFGLNEQEVSQYYLQYPDIDKVSVKLSPFWISKVPNIEGKIEIEIAQDLEAKE